jgi:limonene-1,2-epoxide hydrolase
MTTTSSAVFRNSLFTAEDELSNAARVRGFIEGDHTSRPFPVALFDDNVRIFFDSNPSDPVTFPNNECYMGLRALASMNQAYTDKGFTYVVEVHSIYAVGPLVVVARTDYRKEAGQPDLAFPAVGVFAFKNDKIIEWSDYYR